MPDKQEEKKTEIKAQVHQKKDDVFKFKGRFMYAIGKRKTATAQIRLYKKGSGIIQVNEKRLNYYFTPDHITLIKQPLKLTGNLKSFNFSIITKGGGRKSQAEAIRHGFARILVDFDEKLKLVLKPKGWLTRDARKKERKKPGLKKARRAPQWSKR